MGGHFTSHHIGMNDIHFRKTASPESFSNQLRCPYVHHVISHDREAGTLRFDGYFHDGETEGDTGLPRVARMSGVGLVRILEKKIGPDTGLDGRESTKLSVGRAHAAAASSAPFEPIPEPEPPSARELELRLKEKDDLRAEREAARKRPGFDEFDYMNIVFTPTQIVDIRYEIIEATPS